VDPEEPVDGEPLEQTVIDHRLGPTSGFLGGLEDGADRAVEPVLLCQERGGPQQHGHVAVVTTGMHRTWVARGVVDAALLGDRQGVELRAQPHRPPRRAAGQRSDKAGDADADRDVVPELAQDPCDVRAGLVLGERGLGDPVQVVPPAAGTGDQEVGDDGSGHA
jgi:hypothetical protein